MSFTIELMTNNSANNVLDKSLTNLSSVTGVLKSETSIMNPVIQIEGTLPTNCNYMYISEFGRYYYVNDVRSITANIFEISAHVDVLKTYASQIRGCEGIIARQRNNYNLYLDDGTFKTYQNPRFKKIAFDSGFDTMEFVLAVAGRS